MSKIYYVHHRGQQSGPYTEAEISTAVSNGSLNRTDQCWCEGMDNWQRLDLELNLPQRQEIPADNITAKLFGKSRVEASLKLLLLALLVLAVFIELQQQRETKELQEELKPPPNYQGGKSYEELLDEYRKESPHLGRPDVFRFK